MSAKDLQTDVPELSFRDWREELIQVTAKETRQPVDAIKINDKAAYQWWIDGFTPYVTFRECYKTL